jgi:hypothetical protein
MKQSDRTKSGHLKLLVGIKGMGPQTCMLQQLGHLSTLAAALANRNVRYRQRVMTHQRMAVGGVDMRGLRVFPLRFVLSFPDINASA